MKTTVSKTGRWMALTAILATPLVAASADNDPNKLYEYRHEFMEGLGKHMKAASMIAKGEVTVSKADMVLHANALHNSSKALLGLFPKDTGPDKVQGTEALPAIWEKWSDFEAANAKYEAETKKLVEVAEKGDLAGFKAQFGNVGKSCGGCHDSFREEH